MAWLELSRWFGRRRPLQDARPKRNQNLDGLRAIAVFMVFCRHYPYLPGSSHGWAGVDLFFVLSGYLISGLLFRQWDRTGSLHIPRFYVRRGLKIYPAFYVLIAVTPVFAGWMPTPPRTSQYWAEILFLQGYFKPLWPHTWSLSVEEQFYFFVPLVLWAMARFDKSADPFRHVVKVFAVSAVVCLVLRVAMAWSLGEWDLSSTIRSYLRIDSLMFGVVLCYFRLFRPETFRRLAESRLGWVLLALAAATLLSFRKEQLFTKTIGLTIIYLGFGFLLVHTLDAVPPRILRPVVRFLAYVGFYPYSIYLWHMPVRWMLIHWEPLRFSFLSFATFVVAATGFGIVASKLIEIPVLAYRDRYFPESAGSPARSKGAVRSPGALPPQER